MAKSLYYEPNAYPFGDGSHEFKEKNTDIPTIEHEFKGHRLIPGNEANHYKWTIEAIGFSTHPTLSGQWTDVPSCERAIDAYWFAQEINDKNKNQ